MAFFVTYSPWYLRFAGIWHHNPTLTENLQFSGRLNDLNKNADVLAFACLSVTQYRGLIQTSALQSDSLPPSGYERGCSPAYGSLKSWRCLEAATIVTRITVLLRGRGN